MESTYQARLRKMNRGEISKGGGEGGDKECE